MDNLGNESDRIPRPQPENRIPITNVNQPGQLVFCITDITKSVFKDISYSGLKPPRILGSIGLGFHDPGSVCFSMVAGKDDGNKPYLTGLEHTVAIYALGPKNEDTSTRSRVGFLVNPKYLAANSSKFLPVGRHFLVGGPLHRLGIKIFGEESVNQGTRISRPRWDDEVECKQDLLPSDDLIGIVAHPDLLPELIKWIKDIQIPSEKQLPIYDYRGVLLYDPQQPPEH